MATADTMPDDLERIAHEILKTTPTALLIGGEWMSGGQSFEVTDPGSSRVIAEVADATVEDAIASVDTADRAFRSWSQSAPRVRAEILRRAFELMIARQEQIARVIALESGKPVREARMEVSYAAEFLRWFSEEAVRIDGEFHTSTSGTNRVIVMRQAIGVAFFITPWNFPAAMATRKIGSALAAGCTVVLKPAKETPLTALLVGQIFEEAGLPDGVLNIIPTTNARGLTSALLSDPRIRKLSFTGSTQTGRVLLAQASEQIINCSMELGGNAPFIVFNDADIDGAVSAAMVAKSRNGGQSCTAANRFYVHRDVLDQFYDKFANALDSLNVGHGLHEATELGAVISEKARDEINNLVGAAQANGATVRTGRTIIEGTGSFVAPTLLADVAQNAPILREEIFGPVAPIVAFDDEDEVISLANDTSMGLVGFVCSSDFARAMRVSERLECGMVGINRGVVSDPAAPFGGWKQSGLGREGGREGISEYLETKYVAATW